MSADTIEARARSLERNPGKDRRGVYSALEMDNDNPLPTSELRGVDGETVAKLLQGAVIAGHDPCEILKRAAIATAVLGDPGAAIDGRALVRLVRQIQSTLDDVYLGFLKRGCRLALETERIICLLHSENLGEALRVSVRFTQAMAPDVGPVITEAHRSGLQHVCRYDTIEGVDRNVLVWIRFVWIYHFFGWLIGRPLSIRGLSVQGPRPVQENGFDRFALFGCPVRYNAPVDALSYDWMDLNHRLVRCSVRDYEAYYAEEPDWFDCGGLEPSCIERTRQAIIEFQREGVWTPTVEAVATRLRTAPRRLRTDLALEGASFQGVRTSLRGELAGAYLIASDMPVQEIGAMLGFSEPGSFSRHFIAWAGMSPTSYRSEKRSDSASVATAIAVMNERRILQAA